MTNRKYIFCLLVFASLTLNADNTEPILAQPATLPAGKEKTVKDKPDIGKAEPAKPEPAKEVTIDMGATAIFALKEAYKKEKSVFTEPLKEKLLAILQQNITEADQLYEQKKKGGNVKGMAIAKDMKSMLTDFLDQLNKSGEIKFPGKVRDELADKLELIKKEYTAGALEVNDKITALEASYLEKFKTAASPQLADANLAAADAEKLLKEKFAKFLKEEIKCSEPPPPKPGEAANPDEVAKEKEPESPIIASKGNGNKWSDIGELNVTTGGAEVIRVNLKASDDYSEVQPNAISGSDTTIKYRVIKPITSAKDDFAYRLMRVPGKGACEVLEWPSNGNNMALVIRTNKGQTTCSFIIQASFLGKDSDKAFGKEKSPSVKPPAAGAGETVAASVIEIPVRTTPDGASVMVDGQIYRGAKGETVKTPCNVLLTNVSHKLKIIKTGYIDKLYPDFTPAKGAAIQCNLELDPNFKKLQFPANTPDWKALGINVKNGDKVVIVAEGSWSCGDSKDRCGPEGYPSNDIRFGKYYLGKEKDNRLMISAYYGCILFKVGKEGNMQAYTSTMRDFTAPADGEIYMGVNQESSLRKRNSGVMSVLVGVIPAGPR